MDNRLVLLAAVVVASGCTHMSGPLTPSNTPSGSGLEVETFDVSDESLNPGQQAIVTAKLRNFHEQSIEINDISLYNTGILVENKQGCSPSSSEIDKAREDYIPVVECTWTLKAPEEEIEGFDSKTIPVKLNLAYNSQLSNSDQPVKIHFQPLDEIEQTNDVTRTFSNNEVQMEIKTQSPAQFEGTPVTVSVRNSGNGRVDSDYSFEYFPEEIFSNCPAQKERLVESEAQFTCEISPQSENLQTRNLVISTSYKYVKAPTLDVEVVNR